MALLATLYFDLILRADSLSANQADHLNTGDSGLKALMLDDV